MTSTTIPPTLCPAGQWTLIAAGSSGITDITIQGPTFGYRVAVGSSQPSTLQGGDLAQSGTFSQRNIGSTDNIYVTPVAASDIVVNAITSVAATSGGGGGAVTIADGADVTMGAKADSAATTDTGTFSLIALTKRLLTKLPIGQGAMVASLSVTLASDQVLPLPTGAATAAKQDTGNAALATINTTLGTPLQAGGNVAVTALPALPAGSNIIGSILGRTARVEVTPTITAAAYTTGNGVGGIMTFANVFTSANSGILQSVRLKCLSVQTCTFKLYLFRASPAGTLTDKNAPAIAAGDVPGIIGPFALTAPDSGLGTETTWTLDGIGAAIGGSSANLYAVLVVVGTPTFASTSDLTLSLTVLQD